MQIKHKNRKYIKNITKTGIFIALIVVGAFIKFKTPFMPVYFTMQTFFILLAAFSLEMKYALSAALIYIFIGLIGVPVFSGGGGIAYVLAPSFGYMVGFFPCIIICNLVLKVFKNKNFAAILLSSFLGIAAMYFCGVVYMGIVYQFVLGAGKTIGFLLVNGFFLFLPAEILKVVSASIISLRLQKL